MDTHTKEHLIRLAMDEAQVAIDEGNSPFGAVIADLDGNVIATAHNTVNTETDPTAHAELNVIRKVAQQIDSKDLSNCVLVSNVQSCPMCFCAAVRSKISHFMYGYPEDETLVPKLSVFDIQPHCPTKVHIESMILHDACRAQLTAFRTRPTRST